MRILHLESTISFYTFILELESFEDGYPPKKIADKGKRKSQKMLFFMYKVPLQDLWWRVIGNKR